MGKLPPPLFHQLLPHSAAINANYCRAEAQMSRCYYSLLRRCHSFVVSFYGDRGRCVMVIVVLQCASYFSGRTIFGRQLATGVPSLITWLHANALHCKYQATLIFRKYTKYNKFNHVVESHIVQKKHQKNLGITDA